MADAEVTRREDDLVDSHGIRIHYTVWSPREPRAVVHLLHGVGEHAGRYSHVGAAFARAGYEVWADDHRGHGRTGVEQHEGHPDRLGRLGPGGHRAAVEAVRLISAGARQAHPELPLVLFGHSWGSLMAQIILNTHSDDYDAAILMGTAHRTVRHMNGGNLNARFRHLGDTGLEWLSRDPAVAHAFKADLLTTDVPLLKLFGVRDTLRLLGRPSRDVNDLPLLITVGDDDPLGGAESAHHLAHDYEDRSGLTDVTVKVYEGARHELVNETNQDEVIGDLIAWLDQRVGLATPPGT
ncbi:alpha/beta fold hydrolase [Demequina sp. NBRC 110052]|uniref:alpha/beta fold hydrolase n=1 Tax=Demequina sp. NBRC 110052 TaxID=1570341 RepID=UPI0009FCC56E|nr:alpha/beta fold hydrolase [Demequina sp. NBRC 110052]